MRQFRKLIAIAVAAASVLGARADAVSSDLALAAANAWVTANPGFGARGAAASAEAEYDGTTLMWWVVRLDGGGAVFVAPETSIEPVLAAVPQYAGALPAAHPLRAILRADVANRRRVIAEASVTPRSRGASGSSVSSGVITNAAVAEAVSAAETRWTKLTTARPRARAALTAPSNVIAVVPGFGDGVDNNAYLRFWDQSDYSGFFEQDVVDNGDGTKVTNLVVVRSFASIDPCFNLYTPNNVVCGCVATAGAALLQYFGSTGVVHNVMRTCTYNGTNVVLATISATNRYDWSILPREIGGEEPMTMLELKQAADDEEGGEEGEEGEATQKFNAVKSLLGRATRDMGVCVEMAYTDTEEGSGAQTLDIAKALVNDFGFYRAKAVTIAGTNDYPAIYSDLCKAKPVALSIRGLSGGHAILGVGYGEDDANTAYTRLFMGWGGNGDAWYNLPDIRPENGALFDTVRGAVTSIIRDTPPGMYRTLDEAKAAAAVSMKPILLISGTDGDTATDALMAYVLANYTGEFEIYFADYDTDPYADQNPSYGVFNPLVFDRDAQNRWAFYNGRLAYSTNTAEEAIAETLEEGLEKWHEAYDAHLVNLEASTNGVSVIEVGVKTLGDALYSDLETYAQYDGTFTNGQTVVLTAPDSPVTNAEDGIVWAIDSWEVYELRQLSGGGWFPSVLVADGSGTEASFQVVSNTAYGLYWNWSAATVRLETGPSTGGCVSPNGKNWYPYGETVTVVASPLQTSANWQFDHWYGDTDGCEATGSALLVPMDGPRSVTAWFSKAGTSAEAKATYTLTLAANPEDVTAAMTYGVRSLSYGENTLLNGAMAVSVPETWEDATGGVWRCTGWIGTGSVPASDTKTVVGFDLAADSSITWQWEPKPEDEPLTPPDPPIGPVEGGVTNSALVIYATNGTQLAVQTCVSNAKAGFWYSIWSADEVAGPFAFVSGTYEGTAKQKVADPAPELLVLTIVFDPVAAAKFYRVVVTEEDPEQ